MATGLRMVQPLVVRPLAMVGIIGGEYALYLMVPHFEAYGDTVTMSQKVPGLENL
jgi:hypothetical protein